MNFLRKLSTKKSSDTSQSSSKDLLNTTSSSGRLSVSNPMISSRSPSRSPSRTTPTRRPQQQSTANLEPPPAYTPNDTSNTMSPTAPASTITAASTAADSPYAFLAQFDTIFLIDDSGSMAGRSWRETSAALTAITPICTQYDADGLDIYFLNHRPRTASGLGGYTNIASVATVTEIFQSVRPLGGTPTGTRLHQILKPYLASLEAAARSRNTGATEEIKPLNIIVITDGVPSDDVESVIVQAAKKLDAINAEPWQVGIQFFQVGQEPEAAEDLKELDDALSGRMGIRDIVDTVPWSGDDGAVLSADGLLKVVLGSVNRRLDRRRGDDERLRR